MRKHEQLLLESTELHPAFWTHVQRTESCFLWTGRQNDKGYGVFPFEHDYLLAHRAALIIHSGRLPGSMSVLHSCDVRNCVNPEHLRLGTQKDRDSRGRRAKPPTQKLTTDQVLEIRTRRQNGERGVDLAKEYGVGKCQISGINTRRLWKDVP